MIDSTQYGFWRESLKASGTTCVVCTLSCASVLAILGGKAKNEEVRPTELPSENRRLQHLRREPCATTSPGAATRRTKLLTDRALVILGGAQKEERCPANRTPNTEDSRLRRSRVDMAQDRDKQKPRKGLTLYKFKLEPNPNPTLLI